MSNELAGSPTHTSVRKLIILSLVFFIVPFLGFLFLKTKFDANALYKLEVLHTIAVFAMSTLALLVAFFGYTIYASLSDMRIMFIIFAFFAFGAIFILHAMSLPTLGIATSNFFDVTEQYSLFFVALLVFIGASLKVSATGTSAYNDRWYVFVAVQLFMFLFFLIAIVVPQVTAILVKTTIVPVLLTAALFLGAIVKLLQQYAINHNEFLISIILGISVILNALVIPVSHKDWSIEWWYIHFILVLSFAVASFGILMRLLKKNK